MLFRSVHPGRFLRTEIIEAHDLSVTNAAKILHLSRSTLSSLLNAKAGLAGTGPCDSKSVRRRYGYSDTLMRMQNSYDIARTRSREKEDSRRAMNRGLQLKTITHFTVIPVQQRSGPSSLLAPRSLGSGPTTVIGSLRVPWAE